MSGTVTRSGRKLRRPTTTRRAVRSSSRLPPVERYTPIRKAEFLLTNAATDAEYAVARRAVKKLGLDPDAIPHVRPGAR